MAKAPKVPAIQLYTGDWKKDPALSRCGPATRGVWVDLICDMHDSDRCGKISGTMEQLARIARCSRAEIVAAISEISSFKVGDVTFGNGLEDAIVTVTNRRMYREYKARKQTAKRVYKHRHKDGKFSGNGESNASIPQMYTRSSSSSSSSDKKRIREEEDPPPQAGPPQGVSLKNQFVNYSWFTDLKVTEAWDGFLEMRKRSKKSLNTERAVAVTLGKLHRLGGGDPDRIAALLDQSTANSWPGIWPLKEDSNGKNQSGRYEPRPEKAERRISEEFGKAGGSAGIDSHGDFEVLRLGT